MSKLNEYPSVNNTEEFTPEQKAAFLGSANVISTGIKGGSTVTANIPFTEIAVANPVPTPAAAHADVGKVLTVQQASDPSDPDEIVWAAPQGGGIQLPNIPAITTHSGGDYYIPIFVNPGTEPGHSQGYTEQTLVWKKTSEVDPVDWNFDKFGSK